MLTVLVSKISNSQISLLKKKCEFCKNISTLAIFNDQSFNETLTNDIVSFEQMGPDILLISTQKHMLWVLIRSALVRHF